MIKHIARLNAEVILIGSRQVLEVTAHLVEEFETDFTVGRSASDHELEASVRKT